MVNLNFFDPKLLCDPPFRVSGRWVGGSESGWVGQPKSREGQFNPPPPPSITKQWPGGVPAPQTKVTIVGKTKFAVGGIWSGHCWYTNFWVPDPTPPSLLTLLWGGGAAGGDPIAAKYGRRGP